MVRRRVSRVPRSGRSGTSQAALADEWLLNYLFMAWLTPIARFAPPPRRRRGTKVAGTRLKGDAMIRKLASGGYRLYSRKKDTKTGKRRNLGTFKSLAAAQRHERAVQFFKRK